MLARINLSSCPVISFSNGLRILIARWPTCPRDCIKLAHGVCSLRNNHRAMHRNMVWRRQIIYARRSLWSRIDADIYGYAQTTFGQYISIHSGQWHINISTDIETILSLRPSSKGLQEWSCWIILLALIIYSGDTVEFTERMRGKLCIIKWPMCT